MPACGSAAALANTSAAEDKAKIALRQMLSAAHGIDKVETAGLILSVEGTVADDVNDIELMKRKGLLQGDRVCLRQGVQHCQPGLLQIPEAAQHEF